MADIMPQALDEFNGENVRHANFFQEVATQLLGIFGHHEGEDVAKKPRHAARMGMKELTSHLKLQT
jgi:hypothetical protein